MQELLAIPRPTTRAECPTERPCPWVGCKYHLALEVAARKSTTTSSTNVEPRPTSICLNAPSVGKKGRRKGIDSSATEDEVDAFIDRVVERLETAPATCALDVAEQGGLTALKVGELLGTSEQLVNALTRNTLSELEPTLYEHRHDIVERGTGSLLGDAQAMAPGRLGISSGERAAMLKSEEPSTYPWSPRVRPRGGRR